MFKKLWRKLFATEYHSIVIINDGEVQTIMNGSMTKDCLSTFIFSHLEHYKNGEATHIYDFDKPVQTDGDSNEQA